MLRNPLRAYAIILPLCCAAVLPTAENGWRLETPEPTPLVRIVLPGSAAGFPGAIAITLTHRGGVFVHGHATVPERDNLVHRVQVRPRGLEGLALVDGRLIGHADLLFYDPEKANENEDQPGRTELRLSIDAKLDGKVLRGNWKASSGLSARGDASAYRGSAGELLPGSVIQPKAPAEQRDLLDPRRDWPQHLGPFANGSAQSIGVPMVEDLRSARLVWASEERIPPGRVVDPRHIRDSVATAVPGRFRWGVDPGETHHSPVVAGGRVYQVWVRHSLKSGGEDEAKKIHAELRMDELGFPWGPEIWGSGGDDIVDCYDAATGVLLWRQVSARTGYLPPGKTNQGGTPCVADGRLYVATHGGAGMVCFDATDGRLLWSSPQERSFHGPRLIGGTLVVPSPESLIGLDPATGKRRWNQSEFIKPVFKHCSYPGIATIAGKEWIVIAGAGAGVIDPADGAVRWRIPRCAVQENPTVCSGDLVAVPSFADDTKTPDTGARGDVKRGDGIALWRLTPEGPIQLWFKAAVAGNDDYMGRAYGLDMIHDSVLYTWGESTVHAIRLPDGKPLGKIKDAQRGTRESRLLIGCDGRAFPLGLFQTAIRQDQLVELGKTWGCPLAHSYRMRNTPALADGRMYVRTHDSLVCYDLRQGKPTAR